MAAFLGTVYGAALEFTKQRYGGEAPRRCLEMLDPEDRAVLDRIVPTGTYPAEPILRFHRAVDDIYGQGDLALCREIGRFAAQWSLSTFLKFTLRFRGPYWLFDKATAVWKGYYGSGRWELERVDPCGLRGRLYDCEVVDRAFCLRIQGFLRGASEMTGAKAVRIYEPHCRVRGAAHCEFRGEWESG